MHQTEIRSGKKYTRRRLQQLLPILWLVCIMTAYKTHNKMNDVRECSEKWGIFFTWAWTVDTRGRDCDTRTLFFGRCLMRMWHAPRYGGFWAVTSNNFAHGFKLQCDKVHFYWQPFRKKSKQKNKTPTFRTIKLFRRKIAWRMKIFRCVVQKHSNEIIGNRWLHALKSYWFDSSAYSAVHEQWNWKTCG